MSQALKQAIRKETSKQLIQEKILDYLSKINPLTVDQNTIKTYSQQIADILKGDDQEFLTKMKQQKPELTKAFDYVNQQASTGAANRILLCWMDQLQKQLEVQ